MKGPRQQPGVWNSGVAVSERGDLRTATLTFHARFKSKFCSFLFCLPSCGAKRGPSQLAAEDARPAPSVTATTAATATPTPATMSSYDNIDDEEELHKMMTSTESFEDRKKIRARLKDLREKQRAEMEARRLQREKEAEDVVRKKFERAEEEKKRKMQAYSAQKPVCERESEYVLTTEKLITDKHKQAEEEKQKKLDAYKRIAGQEHKTASPAAGGKAPDGTTGVTKKTETTTKQTSGFGGVQYGAAKAPAKPTGARGAMAAFKQMDAASPAPKQNKPAVTRSPSAIKTMLLEWCKAMTREYENIEVTNFSTSWNNGLAFCALIHHFYPDAFDYSQLDPKNRRYNFELAFNTAEKMADIAPLLDVDDMVKMKNPDWKCVFTYVQSFYRHLRDHENNKAKAPVEA